MRPQAGLSTPLTMRERRTQQLGLAGLGFSPEPSPGEVNPGAPGQGDSPRVGVLGELGYGGRNFAEQTVRGAGDFLDDRFGWEGAGDALEDVAGFVGPSDAQDEAQARQAADETRGLMAKGGDAIVQELPGMAATIGAGAAAGAAAGSIIPGAGTIVGGLVGAGLGALRVRDDFRQRAQEQKARDKYGVDEAGNVKATPEQVRAMELSDADINKLDLTSLIASIPEAVTPLRAITRIGGKAAAGQVMRRALTKAGVREGSKDALIEGSTEVFQEALGEVVFNEDMRAELTELEVRDMAPYVKERYGEEIALSFIAGAGLGGVSGGATGAYQQQMQNKLLEKQAQTTATRAIERGLSIDTVREAQGDPKKAAQMAEVLPQIDALEAEISATTKALADVNALPDEDPAKAEMIDAYTTRLTNKRAELEQASDAIFSDTLGGMTTKQVNENIAAEAKARREEQSTIAEEIGVSPAADKDPAEVQAAVERMVEARAERRKAGEHRNAAGLNSRSRRRAGRAYREALEAEGDAYAQSLVELEGVSPAVAAKRRRSWIKTTAQLDNVMPARDQQAAQLSDGTLDEQIERASAIIPATYKDPKEVKSLLAKRDKADLLGDEETSDRLDEQIARMRMDQPGMDARIMAALDVKRDAEAEMRLMPAAEKADEGAADTAAPEGQTEAEAPVAEVSPAEASAGQPTPTADTDKLFAWLDTYQAKLDAATSPAQRNIIQNQIAATERKLDEAVPVTVAAGITAPAPDVVVAAQDYLNGTFGPAERNKILMSAKQAGRADVVFSDPASIEAYARELTAASTPAVDPAVIPADAPIRQGDAADRQHPWQDLVDETGPVKDLPELEASLLSWTAESGFEASAMMAQDGTLLGVGTNNDENRAAMPMQGRGDPTVTFTHTHPYNTPMSKGDIEVAIAHTGPVRAVLPDGQIVEMRAVEGATLDQLNALVAGVRPYMGKAVHDNGASRLPLVQRARITQEAQLRIAADAGLIEYTRPISGLTQTEKDIINDIIDEWRDAGRPGAGADGRRGAGNAEPGGRPTGDAGAGVQSRPTPTAAGREAAYPDFDSAWRDGVSNDELVQRPEFVNAVGVMLTRTPTSKKPGFDTAAWHRDREYVFGGETVVGTEAAVERHVEIARELAAEELGRPVKPTVNGRVLTIITGPPASGKSTIANEIAYDTGSAIVDSDEVKKTLPEFGLGEGANAVHKESKGVATAVEQILANEGANIVYPKVGHEPGSIEKLGRDFKARGYEVRIVNLQVPVEEAMRRMLGRFGNTGRLIPPTYLLDAVGDNPQQVHAQLAQRNEFDGYAQLDGLTPYGQRPAVLHSSGRALTGTSFDVPGGSPAQRGSPRAQPRAAEDRGQASPIAQAISEEDAAILDSLSPEARKMVNPIYTEDVPAKGLRSNEAAARWLEARFSGTPVADFTKVLPDDQKRQIGEVMAAEAQLALARSGNAYDWYSHAMVRAMDMAAIKYPMLTNDAAAAEAGFGDAANAKFVFTYIMAVTSQNLDVKANAVATDKAFSAMLQKVAKGDFTMDPRWGTGDKRKAMGENFAKFGPLIKAMDGGSFPEQLKNLDAMFREENTVGGWVAAMKEQDIPFSPPGQTSIDTVVSGSSLLGPKIGGGFWQNLNGNFTPLTIDLWMRRTWGRMTGKSIGNESALPAQTVNMRDSALRSMQQAGDSAALAEVYKERRRVVQALNAAKTATYPTKKARAAAIRELRAELNLLKDIAGDVRNMKISEPWSPDYEGDPAALAEYAKRVLKPWDKKYKELQNTDYDKVPAKLKPTWVRAASRLKADLTTPLDQVANGTQRQQIEDSVRYAQQNLYDIGVDVTIADLQAILWYPEKDLWDGLRKKLETSEDGTPVIQGSNLNESYDGVFRNILTEQGYDVPKDNEADRSGDGSGGAGSGAVAGRDGRSERPEGPERAGRTGNQDTSPVAEGVDLSLGLDVQANSVLGQQGVKTLSREQARAMIEAAADASGVTVSDTQFGNGGWFNPDTQQIEMEPTSVTEVDGTPEQVLYYASALGKAAGQYSVLTVNEDADVEPNAQIVRVTAPLDPEALFTMAREADPELFGGVAPSPDGATFVVFGDPTAAIQKLGGILNEQDIEWGIEHAPGNAQFTEGGTDGTGYDHNIREAERDRYDGDVRRIAEAAAGATQQAAGVDFNALKADGTADTQERTANDGRRTGSDDGRDGRDDTTDPDAARGDRSRPGPRVRISVARTAEARAKIARASGEIPAPRPLDQLNLIKTNSPMSLGKQLTARVEAANGNIDAALSDWRARKGFTPYSERTAALRREFGEDSSEYFELVQELKSQMVEALNSDARVLYGGTDITADVKRAWRKWSLRKRPGSRARARAMPVANAIDTPDYMDLDNRGGPGRAKIAMTAITRFAAEPKAVTSTLLTKVEDEIFNAFAPIRRLEIAQHGELKTGAESAYKNAEMAVNDAGRNEALMHYGAADIDQHGAFRPKAGTKGLRTIFDEATAGGSIVDWMRYMAAKRAKDLNARGIKTPLTQADIAQGLALENSAFKLAADDWRRHNNANIDFLVKTGRITRKQATALKQEEHYVPFYRSGDQMADGSSPEFDLQEALGTARGAGRGRDSMMARDPGIKKIVGGDKTAIDNLLHNMMRNSQAMVAAGMRNQAANLTFDLLETAGYANALPTTAAQAQGAISPGAKPKNAVKMWRGGQERWVVAEEEAFPVIKAMAALQPIQLGGIQKLMVQTAAIFRQGITLSPAFMVRNAVRGLVATGLLTSGANITMANNTFTGFKDALRRGDATRAFTHISGMGDYNFGGGEISTGKNDMMIDLGARPATWGYRLRQLIDGAERVGTATEMADRVAAMQTMIANGVRQDEAAYQALAVMNYSRRGGNSMLRAYLPMVPFLNARLQGLSRLTEGAVGRRGATGRKQAAMQLALNGALLSIASALIWGWTNSDDEKRERYKDEPQWRRLNYHVMYFGDTAVYMPKAFELGHLFSSIPEMLLDTAFNDMGDEVTPGVIDILQQTLMFNAIPAAVTPAIEAMTNHSFFTGREIEGTRQQRLEAEDRTEGASPLAKFIGRQLGISDPTNVSPIMIDHFIRGYAGVYGSMTQFATDMAATEMGLTGAPVAGAFGDVPVLSKALSSVVGSSAKDATLNTNKFIESYYGAMDHVTQLYNSAKAARTTGDLERFNRIMASVPGLPQARDLLNKSNRVMGDLNSAIRSVQNDATLRPGAKAAKLRPLISQRNKVAKQVSLMLDKIEEEQGITFKRAS